MRAILLALPWLLFPISVAQEEASGADTLAGLSHADLMSLAVQSAASGDWNSALMAVERSLDNEEFLDELQVAEVHYARGWLLSQPPVFAALEALRNQPDAGADVDGNSQPAQMRPYHVPLGDFAQTRTLAGPVELRLRAIYNLGCLHLFDGEDWRSRIPEIAENGGAAQSLPGMAAPGSPALGSSGMGGAGQESNSEEEPPDPLEEARKAYGRSMAWLIERLQADWRHVDTRANLELIQRRLGELDDIEKQRQEEQEEEEDGEQQEGEDGEQQEGEDGEQQEGEDGEQQENDEPQGGDQEGENQDSKKEEPEPGEEQKQEEQQEGEQGEEQETPKPHEGNPEKAERHLTREEVMRLLDKLSEMEEQYRAFQEAMRAARRIPVERDW
ncbi:MAG: hypothetical protein CMJ89_10675 [Planctomycetes bacterium]|nr:hypothetical protein [Planctomycetota bacterium]